MVQTAAHLRYELFRNVDRKTASLQPAVQNVARMLFAGHAGRAVLAHARAATKAQRSKNRRPKPRRLTLQPARDIGWRFESCLFHSVCMTYRTHTVNQKLQKNRAYKPVFFSANLLFATETRLVSVAKCLSRNAPGVALARPEEPDPRGYCGSFKGHARVADLDVH